MAKVQRPEHIPQRRVWLEHEQELRERWAHRATRDDVKLEGADFEVWVEERMSGFAESYERRLDWDFEKFTDTPSWLANQLGRLIGSTTARLEDLPERSPLSGVSDMEWRPALAKLYRSREKYCRDIVEQLTMKKAAKDTHHDLTYFVRGVEYTPNEHLGYYAEELRKAQRNYSTLAAGIEMELEEMNA